MREGPQGQSLDPDRDQYLFPAGRQDDLAARSRIPIGAAGAGQDELLANVKDSKAIATFRVIEQFKAAFEGYGDDEFLAAVNQIREGTAADGRSVP